jgi:leucyl-tRNA synthetase
MLNDLTALPAPASGADRAAVREALDVMSRLLAPFMPHVAEELWHELEGPAARDALLAEQSWPVADPALVAADVVTIAVQVNGKLRGEVRAAHDAAEAEVRGLAEGQERVRAHLDGKTVRKVVYVPKRLINFVVG